MAFRSATAPGFEHVVDVSRARTFDVICAGEALWRVAVRGKRSAPSAALALRPGGGALNAALALARAGVRVGLATVLRDDSFGRALRDRIAARGVDIGGVELAAPSTGLLFVQGDSAARRVDAYREDEQPLTVPARWSSQVLLVSGLSPVVSHAAALCKAARAARRVGTIVVVDVNAKWHLWAGRDARATHSVLREADVVRCSAQDLAVLGFDEPTFRAALRRDAVFVYGNAMGGIRAAGPFGRIAKPARDATLLGAAGAGDAFAAALCAEIARAGTAGESRLELWERALERAQNAAIALAARTASI